MNQFFKLFGNLFNGIKLNQEAAAWDASGLLNIREPDSGEIKSQTRSEVFSERVTPPMTVEMREGFERMARELQRKRSQKNERITANTVMRVALEFFMDRFSVEQTDRVNTEEELLDAAKQQLSGK